MKKALFMVLFFLQYLNSSGQNLSGILADYSINKLPSDRPIVGSKWTKDLGATTEGISDDKLIISRSLNQLSLSTENKASLNLALLAFLNLDGYGNDELSVKLNELQIFTIKDLYSIPLINGEMMVFSAVNVKSFDIIYNKNLNASVKAKLPNSKLKIDAEADLGNKKRITINGTNLFIAQKIVKVTKITTSTKTKEFKSGFDIKNLQGYDFNFNTNELIAHAKKKTIDELGKQEYDNLKGLAIWIKKYSVGPPIKVSIMSKEKGSITNPIFSKVLDVCYCAMFGDVNGKLFLINSTNTGNVLTSDYLYIDSFFIVYEKDRNVGVITTQNKNKISVISKSYTLASVQN